MGCIGCSLCGGEKRKKIYLNPLHYIHLDRIWHIFLCAMPIYMQMGEGQKLPSHCELCHGGVEIALLLTLLVQWQEFEYSELGAFSHLNEEWTVTRLWSQLKHREQSYLPEIPAKAGRDTKYFLWHTHAYSLRAKVLHTPQPAMLALILHHAIGKVLWQSWNNRSLLTTQKRGEKILHFDLWRLWGCQLRVSCLSYGIYRYNWFGWILTLCSDWKKTHRVLINAK